MSLGFGDALAAIQAGIDLWQKVKGAQEEVDEMGEQLQTTKVHVAHADQLVPKHKGDKLKELDASLWLEFQNTTTKIKGVAQQARQILDNWLNVAHWLPGAEWGHQWVANLAGVVKGNPGKLRGLREKLTKYQNELDGHIQMLIYLEARKIGSQLNPGKGSQKPTPHPPAPRPSQKSILFVDSYNSGRSVVAQSYMFLVREWTVRTKNNWPLQKFDSAGIRIISRSAFAEQLKSSKAPFQMVYGNTPAFGPAINALFDQPYFNYQYKTPIRQNATKRRSRGLPADIFSGYDYIFVFTREQREILEALRERYKSTLSSMSKKDNLRAKIELLGDYGNRDQAEIAAPRDDDPERDKKWQSAVWNIKSCVKGFLQRQCGWAVPDKKDAHLQREKLQDGKMGK